MGGSDSGDSSVHSHFTGYDSGSTDKYMTELMNMEQTIQRQTVFNQCSTNMQAASVNPFGIETNVFKNAQMRDQLTRQISSGSGSVHKVRVISFSPNNHNERKSPFSNEMQIQIEDLEESINQTNSSHSLDNSPISQRKAIVDCSFADLNQFKLVHGNQSSRQLRQRSQNKLNLGH